jgi:hypothetical protein
MVEREREKDAGAEDGKRGEQTVAQWIRRQVSGFIPLRARAAELLPRRETKRRASSDSKGKQK